MFFGCFMSAFYSLFKQSSVSTVINDIRNSKLNALIQKVDACLKRQADMYSVAKYVFNLSVFAKGRIFVCLCLLRKCP